MESFVRNLYNNDLKNLARQNNLELLSLIKKLYTIHYELEELGDTKNRSDGKELNVKQGQKRKRGRPKKKQN